MNCLQFYRPKTTHILLPFILFPPFILVTNSYAASVKGGRDILQDCQKWWAHVPNLSISHTSYYICYYCITCCINIVNLKIKAVVEWRVYDQSPTDPKDDSTKEVGCTQILLELQWTVFQLQQLLCYLYSLTYWSFQCLLDINYVHNQKFYPTTVIILIVMATFTYCILC